jgi:hypothetical protein
MLICVIYAQGILRTAISTGTKYRIFGSQKNQLVAA